MVLFAVLLLAAPADLDKACKGGRAAACYELANAYKSARGVPRDLKKAADLWRRACKLGDKDACADDAFALVLGTGQYADPVPALARLEKYCKQGQQRACGNLGTLFAQGYGGKDGPERAPGLLSAA